MSVTLEVSHPEMSTSKEAASKNMRDMSVTLEVSHPEMSPLKEVASENMLDMSVTAEVSHELPLVLMSWLKEEASENV